MREGMPPLSVAIDLWLDDLLLAGKAQSTAKGYRSSVRNLVAFTPEGCRDVIRPYVGKSTACTVWAALRSFSGYAVDQGWVAESPMLRVPRPKKRQKAHRFLTRQEIAKVWHACQSDQQRLVIRLLLTGLRASELLSIRKRDIHDGVVSVVGKGQKQRLVSLDAETLRLITCDPIVPMQYRTLHRLIKNLGWKAKVAGLTPHLFRHSWASWALEEGVDGWVVQEAAGWSSPKMLATYTASMRQRASARRMGEVGLTNRLLEPPQ